MMALKILIVDDHEIMREGICALLRRQPGFEVVGQAADGRTALDRVKQLCPAVVIMDIGMPNLNGIDATRRIVSEHPPTKVMALSGHSDAERVARMIHAGASGYILKESAFSELAEGLLAVAEGKPFFCSKISQVIFTDYLHLLNDPKSSFSDKLSSREHEVLQLVAEGHTTKEISRMLDISTKTIDTHRDHIMQKLHIRSIAGLTKYAIDKAITNT